ncbi:MULTISPECIES: hypothetical protein [unclassified Rathayibacter]|uniref:hypothetical protein n=1 Tax=unclassified Rathayibacter TaxID=2609250 RepID=UPI000CE8BEF0|nr:MULTISPECIES: hypothetical protein [unclassified Rathayibacter]PPF18420.1 hypothetical protein C5B92_06090 [Rathayibacter sp. AY1A4]PPH30187.1 hypothetical protein C5C94_10500 [Rathayibacter sp. AY1C3]PPI31187.1 hypothetical protein C5D66_07385 [Rathayibacter sp. AY1B4]
MRRLRALAAALLLLPALAACAPGGATGVPSGTEAAAVAPTTATPAQATPTQATPDPARSSASSAPAPGVTVSVQQNRSDIAGGTMAFEVHNGSGVPIEVTAARLTDPRLAAPLTWTGGTGVPDGASRDLRVDVPEPACPVAEAPAALEVVLAIDGHGEHAYPADDPFSFVDALARSGCFARTVDADLALRIDTSGGAAHEPARLTITADVRGTPLVLRSVDATILLQPPDAADAWTLDRSVPAGTLDSVVLDAVPTRCDTHALAEDKVGTRLPVTVETAGRQGTVVVAATPEQKGELYAFITAYCAS